jgi:hypothetical protein
MHADDLGRLAIVSDAITGALVLAEGLERLELDGSRITRLEISRLLLVAADAIDALSGEARGTMAELDARAWLLTAARLRSGGAEESDARWFTLQALAPATLGWLNVYASQGARRPLPARG